MSLLLRLGLILVCSWINPGFATQHSITQKIFQVESEVLANGLHVIRHHRENSDTFSAQLIVELGLQDFNCHKKQTPHILEHMLFEGTRQYDRKTLRQRVRNHGGKSHAFTVEEYTHYTLDVHSDYPEIALENLFSMVTESLFQEESFRLSQQIIHTELGTNNGNINPLWSSTRILTNMAKAQLYEGTELYCPSLTNPNHITLDEAKRYYDSHYVASNMTLILLGHFDNQRIEGILKRTFATMATQDAPARKPVPKPSPNYTPIRESTTAFDPMAELYMFIPAVGEQNPQAKTYQLISEYLGEQLFYTVRGEKGLGYTPRARLINNSDIGLIQARSRTNDQLLAQAETAFLGVYERLLREGIPNRDIQRLKRKMILEFESQQRNHSGLAQLYRHHRQRIRQTGTMPNLVQSIHEISPATVQTVLNQLPQQPLVATISRPPLTRVILYIIMISVIATTLAWPLLRWMRKQSHR